MSEPAGLVTRHAVRFEPDPSRVITQLFVPGEERLETRSRATSLVRRVAALPESTVHSLLEDVLAGFSGRHRDLEGVLIQNASIVSHRLVDPDSLSPQRRLLLGAYFTHEYAVEAAALCNPSLMVHPDQDGLAPGELRVALSLRAIGEGHISSLGFATGVVGPHLHCRWDARTGPLSTAERQPSSWDGAWLRAALTHAGRDDEVTATVISSLPEPFDQHDLDRVLASLPASLLEHLGTVGTVPSIRELAAAAYTVRFADDTQIAQRVLWPIGAGEGHGMEDARFVSFTADDGATGYRATYTAYSGSGVAPRLLESADLLTFRSSALTGPAARNKGMALFPRTVRGRHLALCRGDGETMSLAASDDGRWWDDEVPLHGPTAAWELMQVGNCGSPLETPAGWLVLTHGVGPMRTYAIGALLLDLEHPSRVIATLPGPLLVPDADERDGYVPNVVYSCGGLIHDGTLWMPYGSSDARVSLASVRVEELLAQLAPS